MVGSLSLTPKGKRRRNSVFDTLKAGSNIIAQSVSQTIDGVKNQRY